MFKPFPEDSDYLISDEGQIFSVKRREFMTPKSIRGYLQIGLRHRRKKQQTYQINRLVLMTFDRFPLENEHAHHKNNIKNDNRLSNLMWVSCQENQKLKEQFGTVACDERHGMSTISNSKVKEIRFLSSLGLSDREIAKTHGISKSQVNKITNKIQRKRVK